MQRAIRARTAEAPLAANSAVTVNAFGPGLITRTGFPVPEPLFVKLFDFATNDIFHVAETVDGGGDCLVYMTTSPALEGKGGLYYNNGIAPGEGRPDTSSSGGSFPRRPGMTPRRRRCGNTASGSSGCPRERSAFGVRVSGSAS